MRFRDTVAIINLPNLYENYVNIQKIVKTKKVIPVVKANAYGHGAIPVTRYLVNKGIDYFAVSLLEEALELREEFSDIEILVMGITESIGLLFSIENNVTVTVSNFDQIQNLYEVYDIVQNVHNHYDEMKILISKYEKYDSKYFSPNELKELSKLLHLDENLHSYINRLELLKIFHNASSMFESLPLLNVHLKVDTGMNRLGFKSDKDILSAFQKLIDLPLVNLEGLYSHFSTADENETYYNFQLDRFKEIIQLLDYPFSMVHLSNSSSQIKYEKDIPFTTHTRLGISLYGLTLDDNVSFLQNTFVLRTKISQIKELVPGDKVGYGATYTATSNEVIGILPIGYADGFIRQNQGGFVEINNKRYELIGRICMDQCFVRIDDTVTKDDDVILFGQLISIDEVAGRLNTINYEVICEISNRVPREYIE